MNRAEGALLWGTVGALVPIITVLAISFMVWEPAVILDGWLFARICIFTGSIGAVVGGLCP